MRHTARPLPGPPPLRGGDRVGAEVNETSPQSATHPFVSCLTLGATASWHTQHDAIERGQVTNSFWTHPIDSRG